MMGVVKQELRGIDAYLLEKVGTNEGLQGQLVLALAHLAESMDILWGEKLGVLTDLGCDLEEVLSQITWQGGQTRE